ncbi:hypothetical protein D3C77_489830 [compost metagenome]
MQAHKGLGMLQQAIIMMAGGLPLQPILRQSEAAARRLHRPCILDPEMRQQFLNLLAIRAVGIGHAAHGNIEQMLQIFSILQHFIHNELHWTARQGRMPNGMYRRLMSLIQRQRFLRRQAILPSQQPGVHMKRSSYAIAIKNPDQPLIRSPSVVITHRKRLMLPLRKAKVNIRQRHHVPPP